MRNALVKSDPVGRRGRGRSVKSAGEEMGLRERDWEDILLRQPVGSDRQPRAESPSLNKSQPEDNLSF